MDLEALKYPIGKFIFPSNISDVDVKNYIAELEHFPKNLLLEISSLNQDQLDTQYRPEGWTIRQIIHHCADSHMNSFIRLKWALTENNPTIKTYFEEKWADLPDSSLMPVQPSIQILEAVHTRYVYILRNLPEAEFNKTFIHPEQGRIFSIKQHIALYAWHGKHHLAQITSLKNRNGWA